MVANFRFCSAVLGERKESCSLTCDVFVSIISFNVLLKEKQEYRCTVFIKLPFKNVGYTLFSHLGFVND